MSLAEYVGRIRAAFPGLAAGQARLVTAGWDHDIVVLGERLVFRFPKRPGYDARFRAEVKLLRHLGPRLPVSAPLYIYMADDESFGGYELLPGVEMTAEVFARFDVAQREHVARQLGEFLSVVHAVPVETARSLGIDEEAGGRWMSPRDAEETLPALKERVFPKLSREETDWIEHQFARYAALSFDLDLALLHSDLQEEHILADPDRGAVTGVIDFGDAELSDPAFDFAGLWAYGEEFPERVLRYYACRTDADFLRRSKVPVVMHMPCDMLELANGRTDLPVTFESLRAKLRERMDSGISL